MQVKELTTNEIKLKAASSVAVLPVGATEQHGPHLSVLTDTMIVTEIAQRVEKVLHDLVILYPTLQFGSSHHHLDFPGTMSLPAELYSRVIVELVTSLVTGGFRRIIILNGHGGNIVPVKQALAALSYNLDDKFHPNIALVTYWETAGKTFAGEPPMQSPSISHACEYETRMMLYLFPSSVKMEKVERAKRPPKNGYIGWEDDEVYKGVTMVKKTNYISSNGSSGEPQLADSKKGEHLINSAVKSILKFIDEFSKWKLMENLNNER